MSFNIIDIKESGFELIISEVRSSNTWKYGRMRKEGHLNGDDSVLFDYNIFYENDGDEDKTNRIYLQFSHDSCKPTIKLMNPEDNYLYTIICESDNNILYCYQKSTYPDGYGSYNECCFDLKRITKEIALSLVEEHVQKLKEKCNKDIQYTNEMTNKVLNL